MVNRLRQQSNMTVRPEPQPTWIASKAYDEGTSTPFMARLFLGVLRIRDQIYDASDRKQRDTFDKTYEAVLMNLHSARGASKEIHKLITGHVEEVRKGTCVVRRGNTIQIDENIDQQLRRQTETFLNSAGRAFKSMQELMRLLGREIGFLYQKQQSFERGIEKLKKTQPDLAAYLLEVRAKWSERLTNARNALEHAGWVLPRVRYEDHNGIVVAIEPMVDGESVSQFAQKMLERLACFIEELSIHGLQGKLTAGISITELPISDRDPKAPERFRLALVSGGMPIWQIHYHDRSFEQT